MRFLTSLHCMLSCHTFQNKMMYLFIHSFTHPLTLHTFVERLPWAKYCAGCWDVVKNKTDVGLRSPLGCDTPPWKSHAEILRFYEHPFIIIKAPESCRPFSSRCPVCFKGEEAAQRNVNSFTRMFYLQCKTLLSAQQRHMTPYFVSSSDPRSRQRALLVQSTKQLFWRGSCWLL